MKTYFLLLLFSNNIQIKLGTTQEFIQFFILLFYNFLILIV